MPGEPTDPEPPATGESCDDRQRVERAVRNLQAGRDLEKSFDFLFRRFSPALLRQLRSWGAGAEEARDLNQEVFQRIFRDVDRFRGGEQLFASWVGWIWTIARTTWLQNVRAGRAQKRPDTSGLLDGIDEERDPTIARPPSQLDRVLVREAGRQVAEAIAELPEQERKCVLLYYYQQRKTREIAVILQIAQGTVKAHLSHARAKLKVRLEDSVDFGDERAPGPRAEPEIGGLRA